ncbi:BcsE family c-di-GMP-binding protein [Motilimonas pumila]|nr:BcsE family c-di-GMP-binding protein [Motilimonas pumila]
MNDNFEHPRLFVTLTQSDLAAAWLLVKGLDRPLLGLKHNKKANLVSGLTQAEFTQLCCEQCNALKSDLNHTFSSTYLPSSEDSKLTLNALLNDISALNLSHKPPLLLLWRANQALSSEHWQYILRWHRRHRFNLHLVLICTSPNEQLIKLQPYLQALRHLAEVQLSHSQLRAYIHQAFTPFGLQQHKSMTANLNDETATWEPESTLPQQILSETIEQVFYGQAVIKSGEQAPSHWHCFDDIEQLEKLIGQSQQSCAVFSCEKFEQVKTLAKSIYLLRQFFGPALTILVREIAPCIRYNDLYLLLRCGANNVVTFNQPFSHLVDQVIANSHQLYAKALPKGFEPLLAAYQAATQQSGAVSEPDFYRLVPQAMQQLQTNQLAFALIQLEASHKLSAKECAKYCLTRRSGDIYLAKGQRLLLFLSSIRQSEIAIALANIFQIDINELFANHHIYYDQSSIMQALEQAKHDTLQVTEVVANGHLSPTLLTNLKDDRHSAFAKAVPFHPNEGRHHEHR